MIDLANLKAEGFEAALERGGRAPKACPRAQFGGHYQTSYRLSAVGASRLRRFDMQERG